MKCHQVCVPEPPKVFKPVKIEITIETEEELKYMNDKVGTWAGTTYPLYDLLSNLVAKSIAA